MAITSDDVEQVDSTVVVKEAPPIVDNDYVYQESCDIPASISSYVHGDFETEDDGVSNVFSPTIYEQVDDLLNENKALTSSEQENLETIKKALVDPSDPELIASLVSAPVVSAQQPMTQASTPMQAIDTTAGAVNSVSATADAVNAASYADAISQIVGTGQDAIAQTLQAVGVDQTALLPNAAQAMSVPVSSVDQKKKNQDILFLVAVGFLLYGFMSEN